jgi:hypothetical protein
MASPKELIRVSTLLYKSNPALYFKLNPFLSFIYYIQPWLILKEEERERVEGVLEVI